MTNTRDEKAVQTEIKKHPVLRTLKNVSKIQRQTQEKEAEEAKKQRKKEREQREQAKKEKLVKLAQDFPYFIEQTPTTYSVNLSVSQPAFCQYLLEKYAFLRTQKDNTVSIYKYNGIYYEEFFDVDILSLIQAELLPFNDKARAEGVKSFITTKVIKDIFTFFKCSPLIKKIRIDDFDADEKHIPFNNGVLNIRTGELFEHSKDFLFTRKLDTDFSEEIPETPIFNRYLNHLCTQGDVVNEELKVFLMQYVGAILSNVHGYKYKKFLFMCGEGDTGKSKLRDLTELLLGENYHVITKLESLQNNRFMSAKLFRKRLGSEGDMSFSKASELSVLKEITGGDTLSAERKGIDSFDFKYKGFLWFTSNELLKFGGDKGEHVYNRFLVAYFDNKVPEEKRDSEIVEKMFAEKQGIILKCLQMFKKTLDKYVFDIPQCMADAVKKLQYENSSSLQFFQEYCVQRENTRDCADMLKKEHFYAIYVHIQKQNGERHIETKKDFEKNLQVFLGSERIEKNYRNEKLGVKAFRSYDVKFNMYAFEELNYAKILNESHESYKIDDNHKNNLGLIYRKYMENKDTIVDSDAENEAINKELGFTVG